MPRLPQFVRLGRYRVVQDLDTPDKENPPGMLLLDGSVPPNEVAHLDPDETYRLLQTLSSWFPPVEVAGTQQEHEGQEDR